MPSKYLKHLLIPPRDSTEVVESRRKPCYSFSPMVAMEDYPELYALLLSTRDAVLDIIDPNRKSKKHPIRSDDYIKVTHPHTAFAGPAPVTEKKEFDDFMQLEMSIKDASGHDEMDKIYETLQTHLNEKNPYLVPMGFEFLESSGTIMARYAYKTADEFNQDPSPLLTLQQQIDRKGIFPKWDPVLVRFTTVTSVLCAVNVKTLSDEQIKAIKQQLASASEALKKMDKLPIKNIHVIEYDKRTFSLKHLAEYVLINNENILKP